jgi:ADP-ribose pyrophosphatase YjhB (NUDIX family)
VKNKIRVGSAVILENNKGEILLIKRKNEPAKGKWVLPGGGINFGEHSKETAKRELKEETGYDILVEDFITTLELINPKENFHRVILYHKAKLLGGTLKTSDDAEDAMWVEPKKIKSVENLGEWALQILKEARYL